MLSGNQILNKYKQQGYTYIGIQYNQGEITITGLNEIPEYHGYDEIIKL